MKYKSDEEFLRELLNDFKLEAAEHLEAIVAGLLKLEQGIGDAAGQELIETVFREVHSMKGAARAVNLTLIEQLCMSMESVFHEVKNKKRSLQPGMFDTFYRAIDCLQTMVAEIDEAYKSVNQNDITRLTIEIEGLMEPETQTPGVSFFKSDIHKEKEDSTEDAGKAEKAEKFKRIVKAEKPVHIEKPDSEKLPGEKPTSPTPAKPSDTPASAAADTVRVSAERLTQLLSQAEEMITIKTAFEYQLKHLNELAELGDNGLLRIAESLNLEKRKLALAIDELLLGIRKTLMRAFSTLLNVVPRIVRDLGKEYNKAIDYEIKGGETEIDRRILEEMKDPLIHIIRNCIDHGMETKSERLKNNKPEAGLLKIGISLDSDHKVVIRISDDGRGIDSDKLVNAAIKAGSIKPGDQNELSEQEKLMLLFQSGVSTSPFITDVSGRGLGMAIVDEKVTKIGGRISVESEFGKGSTFTITLPQTMAAFRGLLVKAADQLFLVETTSVVKVVGLQPDDIKTVESKQTFVYDDEPLALVNLADVLAIADRRRRTGPAYPKPVLIIEASHRKIAFVADEVLGEHEGIVKSLGRQLRHVNNIAGATLLGDGRLVPVLHLPELMETALQHGEAVEHVPLAGEDQTETTTDEQTDILVVEDSITVRNVLRNIIEASGFRVTTAVDGMEAYEKLQKETFSLVVSDIDMPRMNGFELTTKIRENRQLADLPVVLVTALESAEDRKRGLEAGANAYIRKGSFDKGNLVETINRLI